MIIWWPYSQALEKSSKKECYNSLTIRYWFHSTKKESQSTIFRQNNQFRDLFSKMLRKAERYEEELNYLNGWIQLLNRSNNKISNCQSLKLNEERTTIKDFWLSRGNTTSILK